MRTEHRWYWSREALAGAIGLAAFATVAGCGDATGPVKPADIVGAYALVSVGGKPLPVPFGEGTEVTSDVFTFAADSTWADESHAQYTNGTGAIVQRYAGQWSLDAGSRVILSHRDVHNQTYYDTLAVQDRGRALTFPGGPAGEWLYQKQ